MFVICTALVEECLQGGVKDVGKAAFLQDKSAHKLIMLDLLISRCLMQTEQKRASWRHFCVPEQMPFYKQSFHHCSFQALPHCKWRTGVFGTTMAFCEPHNGINQQVVFHIESM